MTYSTSAPPKCILPAFGGQGPSLWSYDSTDTASAVDASGYITNGGSLGMKVGDLVFVTDTDASPRIMTSHIVATVSATYPGAVDLSDGVTLGSTNTD